MGRLYPVLKYGAILLWSSFVVAPFLWALTTSFKTINGVTSGPTYLPWLQYTPSLQGWTGLFGGTGGIDIVRPYMNSVVVTLGASAISIVLGTLAAYGLSRFKYQAAFAKNSDIVFFFVSQRIMPPVVLAIPFFLMLRFLGLLDSALGLIIVYVALLLPIAVWVMVDFFNNVPRQLDEMAMLDGCTPLRAFGQVVLPNSLPGHHRRRAVLHHLRLERLLLRLHAHLHPDTTPARRDRGPELVGDAVVDPLRVGAYIGRAAGRHRRARRALSVAGHPPRGDPMTGQPCR